MSDVGISFMGIMQNQLLDDGLNPTKTHGPRSWVTVKARRNYHQTKELDETREHQMIEQVASPHQDYDLWRNGGIMFVHTK